MTLQLYLLLNHVCNEHDFGLNFVKLLQSWLATTHYNLGLEKQLPTTFS